MRWLLDSVYAPSQDGAQAIIHAATCPLSATAPVRPRGMALSTGQEPRSHRPVPPDQLKVGLLLQYICMVHLCVYICVCAPI